jgi:hypothetical protein
MLPRTISFRSGLSMAAAFLVVTRVFEKEVPPFTAVVDWMSGLEDR